MKTQNLTLILSLTLFAIACGDKEEDTATPTDTNVEDTGEEVDTDDTENHCFWWYPSKNQQGSAAWFSQVGQSCLYPSLHLELRLFCV